jgi:hypothetical protein
MKKFLTAWCFVLVLTSCLKDNLLGKNLPSPAARYKDKFQFGTFVSLKPESAHPFAPAWLINDPKIGENFADIEKKHLVDNASKYNFSLPDFIFIAKIRAETPALSDYFEKKDAL